MFFLTGITYSSGGTVIATVGSHQPNIGGGGLDGFLAKFTTNGTRIWSTYYGGLFNDEAWSCFADASGNVYLAGYTNSNNGTSIATLGSHQPIYGGGSGSQDCFLVKFNSIGIRQWGTYYGGNGTDVGISCCTDLIGNVYLYGTTSTSIANVMATPGSHQMVYGNGGADGFLAKFNSSGIRQWGTYYGGNGIEYARSCITDLIGNIYISGATGASSGTSIATAGSHQSYLLGGQEAYLAKFNSAGLRHWGTYYGDIGTDDGTSCAVDGAGNVYLAGWANLSSGTIIATTGSHQPTSGGNYDAFLVKFNSIGTRQWGTYYGGSNYESGMSCASDIYGNVYLAGTSTSSSSIATPGSHQALLNGTGDGFLVQFFDCSTPSAPTNTTPIINQNICTNNSATLYATGSGTINWFASPSSTATLGTGTVYITPTLSPGTYTYYAEDMTCAASLSRTPITVNVGPDIIATGGSICLGQTFTIAPSGATSYTYSSGSALVSPTVTTNYSVTGTSSVGCISNLPTILTITVNSLPNITVNSGSICSGDSFTINPSGANTYTTSSGTFIVTPTITTNYSITGTSTAGCISTSVAISSITVNPLPTITVNSGSICAGDSFTINPSGANTFTISGALYIVTPSITTNYSVTGTGTNGCISNSAAISTITVNALPIISVNNGTICAGDSFTISPSGANTYTFSSGSAVVSPSFTSNYSIVGTSSAGCISNTFATVSITVNPLPTITVNNGTICSGQSFTLSPNGANTYTFSGGSAIVNPTITTNYSVTGTSSLGCVGSVTAISNVIVNLPIINISTNNTLICLGETTTLTASGGNTYTWSTGGTNLTEIISPTITSNYTVTGTDANGCQNTAVYTQSVDACTNIKNQTEPSANIIKIYPNPHNGIFTVELVDESNVYVTNVIGQIILKGILNKGKHNVDLSIQPNGIYFLEISNTRSRQTFKLIKE